MCAVCEDISCAIEQSATLLILGAPSAIMVNDPYSLVEMAHLLWCCADYLLIQEFLAGLNMALHLILFCENNSAFRNCFMTMLLGIRCWVFNISDLFSNHEFPVY